MYREKIQHDQLQLQPQLHNTYNYIKPETNHAQPPERMNLERLLPRDTYLPVASMHLDTETQAELRKQLGEDLGNFNIAKLKNMYLELTGYDPHLTGYVQYSQLQTTLLRHQVGSCQLDIGQAWHWCT